MTQAYLRDGKIVMRDGSVGIDPKCCCCCCWKTSDINGCNGGPQVEVIPGILSSLKVTFENSFSDGCGGNCEEIQKITFDTELQTQDDGGVLTVDLVGRVETFQPGFERLTVIVTASNGNTVSKTIQSVKNRKDDAFGDNTNISCYDLGDCCLMEDVSDSISITLPKGCHHITVISSTIDGAWHQGAYHEANFSIEGGNPTECASELCE